MKIINVAFIKDVYVINFYFLFLLAFCSLQQKIIMRKFSNNIFMYAFFADVKQALIQWQERIEFAHKLLTLLNSYSPPELRNACIGK